MKKIKIVFLSLILIFVGCFFAGCQLFENSGTKITISEDGYWVLDGEKTEYKVSESGEKGDKGDKGDSATVGIDEEGYWVINGIPTDVKARGEDGIDGIDGENGIDGTQISISEDGYWIINGQKSNVKAVGEDGTNGEDGQNGTIVTIENGYWVLDGVRTNVRAEATDGEDGETPTVEIIEGIWYINGVSTGVDARGIAGEDGEDGQNGTIVTIENGYWVLDGVRTNVRAEAEDGEDGETPTVEIIEGIWYINGVSTGVDARGIAGEDGEDGVDGQNGKSAYEIAVLNGFNGTEEEWLESLGITEVQTKSFNKAVNKALTSSVAILTCFNNSSSPSLSGAGVIISDDKANGDAYILTCYHVIYDTSYSSNLATSIYCFLYGQYRKVGGGFWNEYAMIATLVGYSASNDIAVLKISNNATYRDSIAEPVSFRDSDTLNMGDDVLVLGNPASLDFSASTGIISMESENLNYPQPDGNTYLSRFIRTDAAINGGNSGGGMFDIDGNFIGTVKGRYSNVGQVSLDYLGLVVPSNISYNLALNIINNCDGVSNKRAEVVNTGLAVQIDYSNMQKDDNNNIKIVEGVKFTDTISTVSDFWQGGVGADLRNKKLISLTLNKGTANEICKKITRAFQFEEFLYQANVGDQLTIQYENNGVLYEKSAILTQTKFVA